MTAAVHAKLLCKDYVFGRSGEQDCSYCEDQYFCRWRTNVWFVV